MDDDVQDIGPGLKVGDGIPKEHSHGAQYTMRLELSKPLARMGSMEPVTVLYLREPTGADLKDVSLANLANLYGGGEVANVLQRIAMPKLAPHEAASLPGKDLIRVGNGLAYFLT